MDAIPTPSPTFARGGDESWPQLQNIAAQRGRLALRQLRRQGSAFSLEAESALWAVGRDVLRVLSAFARPHIDVLCGGCSTSLYLLVGGSVCMSQPITVLILSILPLGVVACVHLLMSA
jgi:hypothetical protein